MDDLRIQSGPERSVSTVRVAADGRGGGGRQQEQPRQERRPGAPELAVALAEDGRAAMEARYEEDADGHPLIRVLDAERGETVAVLTPDELRTLAEQTGLPPGLLVRASS